MTRSSARRGPWTSDEDQTLLDLVQKQGPNNWVRISQHMQHRTPKQCRERYHQNLKQSLNHEPITHQEGEMIEQMVAEMGRRWAEIARRLGNRSDNAVKNWWNGSMNRRKRNGNQRQPGFKNMGHKVQPIPAPQASRAALMQPPRQLEYHHQIHQGSQAWAEVPATRHHLSHVQMHYSEPSTPGVYHMFDPCLLEGDRTTHHHYATTNAPMEAYPRATAKGGYPEHLQVPSLAARQQYHAPQTLHFAHGSAGELPLISPLGSEGSFAPSLGQPLRLFPTAALHIQSLQRQFHHPDRPSSPLSKQELMSKSLPPDEGYASAITPLEVKQYQHVPGYTIHRPHSHDEYRYQDQSIPLDLSPSSAKDARMNVSSLLH